MYGCVGEKKNSLTTKKNGTRGGRSKKNCRTWFDTTHKGKVKEKTNTGKKATQKRGFQRRPELGLQNGQWGEMGFRRKRPTNRPPGRSVEQSQRRLQNEGLGQTGGKKTSVVLKVNMPPMGILGTKTMGGTSRRDTRECVEGTCAKKNNKNAPTGASRRPDLGVVKRKQGEKAS